MKVNMTMLADDEEDVKQPVMGRETAENDGQYDDADTDEDEDEDEYDEDESDSHSKLKTALLVAAMVGGFALFVWNMTGLVNNMRLDNQGSATNIVYDMEDLSSFMDMSGSGSYTVDPATLESEVSTNSSRDGPSSVMAAETDDERQESVSGDATYDELKKLADEAVNDKALTERELEQAAEMLDASLSREEALKQLLEEHGIDWRTALSDNQN